MKNPTLRTRRHRSAFTLLEMVIVLGIIAMIMGGMIFGMRQIADRAKPTQVKADMNALLSALELYKINNNRYPNTQEGLAAAMPKNNSKVKRTDPWGRDYVYRYPGKSNPSEPEIISLGADGQEGTDDDINSQTDL